MSPLRTQCCVWCETGWIDRISSSHQWRKQTCPSHLVFIKAQTIHVFAKITGGYWPIADTSIRASVSIQANYSVDDMLKFSNQPLSAHQPQIADLFLQVYVQLHVRAPQHAGMKWTCAWEIWIRNVAQFLDSRIIITYNYYYSQLFGVSSRAALRRAVLHRQSADISLLWSVLLILDSFLITVR